MKKDEKKIIPKRLKA